MVLKNRSFGAQSPLHCDDLFWTAGSDTCSPISYLIRQRCSSLTSRHGSLKTRIPSTFALQPPNTIIANSTYRADWLGHCVSIVPLTTQYVDDSDRSFLRQLAGLALRSRVVMANHHLDIKLLSPLRPSVDEFSFWSSSNSRLLLSTN